MPLTEGDKLRILEKARGALQEARRSRYPVVVVLASGEEMALDLWCSFAEANRLAVVDMLQIAQDPAHRLALGAWPTLVDWLRRQAVETGGIVVLDLDAVATQWNGDFRRRLFSKLLKSETRVRNGPEAAPIVVISALSASLDLPTDTRSNGYVLTLHD
jgi:hypothetical protein